MTEPLDTKERRQHELMEIIKELHGGKSPGEVKARFQALIDVIAPGEIAELEERLIQQGLPPEEIKRLCDVHVGIFKDALDGEPRSEVAPGHPVRTFSAENSALEREIENLRPVLESLRNASGGEERYRLVGQWKEAHERLSQVERHYSRKENILFPYLEKHGITGPPKVMWSIHDDIRDQMKRVSTLIEQAPAMGRDQLAEQIDEHVFPMLKAMAEMIFKENNILFPMCMETLTEEEWRQVYDQSDEIGYTLTEPEGWRHPGPPGGVQDASGDAGEPETDGDGSQGGQEDTDGVLALDTGFLTAKQVNLLFNHLPVDITFVDKNNVVRYYSRGEKRVFERTRAVIGRKVENCHPPESVHVVSRLIDDFRENRRDTADFWITMNGAFVLIRYFAVRDELGEYQGVLEVTQDITRARELEGEKRLLSPVGVQ